MGHVPYATMKYVTIYISVCVPNITADRGQRKRLEKWHMYLNIYVSSNIHGNIYGYIYIYIFIYIYIYIYQILVSNITAVRGQRKRLEKEHSITSDYLRALTMSSQVPHMCAMSHAHVCRDVSSCMTWHIHHVTSDYLHALTMSSHVAYMCATAHVHVCHDSCTCVP